MAPHEHLDYEASAFLPTKRRDTYPAIDPVQWNLTGKVVVISGASRGIGRAVAMSYVKARVSGVALLARSANALDEVEAEICTLCEVVGGGKSSPKILKLVVDVLDGQTVADAEARVRDILGRVDIVINSAGYLGKEALIAQSDPEDWWKIWETNVKGTYQVTRAFLPLLQDSEGGLKTIVNLSSSGAFAFFTPGISAYQMAKFSIVRFTEFIAAEYAHKGVLAIVVNPGQIMTELASGLPIKFHEVLADTPEMAGDTIVWLTQGRREWLQGRYVDCDWDMTELEEKRDEIVAGDKLKTRLVI